MEHNQNPFIQKYEKGRNRVRREIMCRIYMSYAKNMLFDAAFVHGFTVVVLGGSLFKLMTPSVHINALLNTRVGEVHAFIFHSFVHAPLFKTMMLLAFALVCTRSLHRIFSYIYNRADRLLRVTT